MADTTQPPTDFAERWQAYVARVGMPSKFPLVRFPAAGARLSEPTRRFLSETGLPGGPFHRPEDPAHALRPVTDVYGYGGPEDDWPEAERARLAPYLLLGSTGGGDPVCLDLANSERVVILNHERGFSLAEFANSSVWQLAECALAFQEMVEEFQNEADDEAELYEGLVPQELVDRTLARIRAIDPAALGERGKWPGMFDEV